MFRFNGDRLRFAELIADVGELEHGNKYERRLTYIRVSTEEQTTYSPAAQLEEIKEFARKNEYCIPEEWIFIDEGISVRFETFKGRCGNGSAEDLRGFQKPGL